MQKMRHLIATALLAAVMLGSVAPAMAAPCRITGVSATAFNVGRYAGSAINKSLGSMLVTVTRTGTDTTCAGRLAFYRPSTPAQMTGALGNTLNYDVQNNASQSLIGNASWNNTVPISYSGPSTTFTVDVSPLSIVIPAGAVPAAGGYVDNTIAVVVFDGPGSGPPATSPVGSASWSVSAAVNPSCTIGTQASATDPVPVRVRATSTSVDTSTIRRTYSSITCNAPSSVTMTSARGGITNDATATGGSTNVINYGARATIGSAVATLDTASAQMTPGTLATTYGAASLSVDITPQQTALPLTTGAYTDTLTITLTPQ